MAPAKKGCWTCKDRKVSCDRTSPTCLRCSKSKRACGGYGLRLSWPQQNDCKRAVASLVAFRDKNEDEHDPSSYQNIQWVNVSSKDVSLHHIATVSRGNSKFRKPQLGREQWAQFQTPLPLPLPLGGLRSASIRDENRLHYFESVLSNMLPMFDSDRAEIRDVLLKMALTDDSHSSRAVLFSLLALSSLHESGPQLRAIQLRDRANRALIRSSQEGLDASAGIKHVAAGVLLCLFEAQGSPERSCVWVGHICGAKYVVNAVRKLDISPGSDASKILGWVYYYEILARFSFRHWRTELVRQAVEELGFEPTKHGCQLQYLIARDSFSSSVPNISDHAHPLLGVLYKVFDIILSPWGAQYHTEEYQTYLDELSSDLENLPLTSTHTHSVNSQSKSPHGPTMVEALELAQLAALVYLERISRNFSGSSAKLAHWSHRAFSLFAKIDTYLFPFPLFILACEASSDAERMVILELLERTERVPHMQNFSDVRMLVERAWSQQDLETEGELEYLRKINIVLSSCDFVPCFW